MISKGIQSYYDCCWDFFNGNLPGQSMAFLPAFSLGSTISLIILLVLYQKQTKIPMKILLINICRRILFLLPTVEHSDSVQCFESNCVRCNKHKEFIKEVINRWDLHSSASKPSPRIKHAVESLCNKEENIKEDEVKELQRPTIFKMKLTDNPCWNDFDILTIEKSMIKQNLSIILEEFQKIFEAFQNGDTWGWKLNDIPNGHWCTFLFLDQGIINESNCRRCPNSSTMILSLPSLMKECAFGNVGFSVIYPGSRIEPHCGPTNLRLRMHLGLHVPDNCWLSVNSKKYKWQAGETLIFDDSFEHSVTFLENSPNDKTPRAVLLMDFWHPEIENTEKLLLQKLLKPLD